MRELDSMVVAVGFDQVEAAQHFLGFAVRAVRHARLAAA